ncbi:MAG: hypothetical protein MJZ66_04410 [Bacteroidales bacterium]|nr:hypothetical protein [Bacteroidales bacterium]
MTESFAFDLEIPVSFNYNYDDLKAQIVEFAQNLVRPAKKSKTFDDVAEDDFEAKMLREPVEPYTVEELHERIAEAERDIAEGRVYSHEKVMEMAETLIKTGKFPEL